MTVRREIAKPRRESGARRPEVPRRTRAERRGTEGRACQTELARAAAFDHLAAERCLTFDFAVEACRSSGSVIAAEVFMNNVG